METIDEGFFQFEIIINVLVSSFRFIWTLIWGYFATPGAILPPPREIDKILWFSVNTIS